MTLRQCKRGHTHREYLAWQAWLEEQWHHPARSDKYLMQIACEVRRTILRNPNSVQADDFELKFVKKDFQPMDSKTNVAASSGGGGKQMTKAELDLLKGGWIAAVGGHVEHRTRSKPLPDLDPVTMQPVNDAAGEG